MKKSKLKKRLRKVLKYFETLSQNMTPIHQAEFKKNVTAFYCKGKHNYKLKKWAKKIL